MPHAAYGAMDDRVLPSAVRVSGSYCTRCEGCSSWSVVVEEGDAYAYAWSCRSSSRVCRALQSSNEYRLPLCQAASDTRVAALAEAASHAAEMERPKSVLQRLTRRCMTCSASPHLRTSSTASCTSTPGQHRHRCPCGTGPPRKVGGWGLGSCCSVGHHTQGNATRARHRGVHRVPRA